MRRIDFDTDVDETIADDDVGRDATIIRIIDSETGDELDAFAGKSIPLPDSGEVIHSGTIDILRDEALTDDGEAYLVEERVFQYYYTQNHDSDAEGVTTMVFLFVVPMDYQ